MVGGWGEQPTPHQQSYFLRLINKLVEGRRSESPTSPNQFIHEYFALGGKGRGKENRKPLSPSHPRATCIRVYKGGKKERSSASSPTLPTRIQSYGCWYWVLVPAKARYRSYKLVYHLFSFDPEKLCWAVGNWRPSIT